MNTLVTLQIQNRKCHLKSESRGKPHGCNQTAYHMRTVFITNSLDEIDDLDETEEIEVPDLKDNRPCFST